MTARWRPTRTGRPWLLMEQATRLVYAGGRMLSRAPGRMLRDSLGYVARGSDSVLFFQWRASRAGAELWHSAMVPHAGPDTAAFREVAALGEATARLGEVAGSTVRAQAAVLLDADSWWALDSQGLRGQDLRYLDQVRRDHAALQRAGIGCDVAQPAAGLSGYRLLLAPALYLVTDEGAESLRRFVAGGGVLVVSFGSGLADAAGQVRLGGYPGALRDLLGVRVEEFFPLPDGETVPLSNGAQGRVWSELMDVTGAQIVASYAVGPLAGHPAVTRNDVGQGSAWYLSTQLDDAAHDQLISEALAAAGLTPEVPGVPTGVAAVRRRSGDGRSWLFLLNHTGDPATVPGSGVDLLTGVEATGSVELPPGGVAVVREEPIP
jgi:beta-galactosidase